MVSRLAGSSGTAPANASPLNLSRMRGQRRSGCGGRATASSSDASSSSSHAASSEGPIIPSPSPATLRSLADAIPGEAAHHDLFAQLPHRLGDQLLDRLLVGADVRLLQETDRFEVLLELAGDDLLQRRLRLA